MAFSHVKARVAWTSIAAAGLVIVVLYLVGWTWLDEHSDDVRNLGIVVAGVIGIPLAIWRSRVAARQAETAQRSLLNDRYQQGSEMLGSTLLSVRLGGIYALQTLATEYSEAYDAPVTRQFCAFARHPPLSGGSRSLEDIQAVMDAVSTLNRPRGDGGAGVVDLRKADLNDVRLVKADLRKVDLSEAKLNNVDLTEANLTEAKLAGADFTGAMLAGTNLAGAHLYDPGGAVTHITQEQLDQACAEPQNMAPIFDGLRDAVSGEPLGWKKHDQE